jgi:hypothetical protein
MIVSFIDDHPEQYGVEPICRQLQNVQSWYYEQKAKAINTIANGFSC